MAKERAGGGEKGSQRMKKKGKLNEPAMCSTGTELQDKHITTKEPRGSATMGSEGDKWATRRDKVACEEGARRRGNA